jgi:hypothetical protein
VRKFLLLSILFCVSAGLVSAQEGIQIPASLERALGAVEGRRSIWSGVNELLASGTVEIIDSGRESKITARGTRTDWSSDPGSCSDVVFEYPARKTAEQVIADEEANTAESDARTVTEGEYVAWLGWDDNVHILFSGLGEYEFSTVWEIADWKAEDVWSARPYFGRACVVNGTAENLEEMLTILEQAGIIGEYTLEL